MDTEGVKRRKFTQELRIIKVSNMSNVHEIKTVGKIYLISNIRVWLQ